VNIKIVLLCIISVFKISDIIGDCECSVPSLKYKGNRSIVKIRAADFNYNPAVGNAAYTINQPGIYYLEDYVNAAPEIDNLSLIYINSSNVKLNLNSLVITQASNQHAKNLNIIEIAPNVDNVNITNGVLQNINGTGLKSNLNVSNLYISNLVIDKLTNLGIYLNNSRNVVLSQLSITNCDGSNPNSSDGAVSGKLQNCSNVRISNSYFNSNIAHDLNTGATGLLVDNCNSLKIENCSSIQNQGKYAYGFVFRNNSNACTINNCSVSGCQSNNGRAVGFLFDNSSSSSLADCISESNQSVGGNCSGFSFDGQTGYYFSAKLKNLNIIKCTSKNNRALGTANDAFGFSGNLLDSAIFRSCKSISNSASDGNAYGFYSGAGINNYFESCLAQDNISGLNTNSIVSGFALLNGEKNSSIKESTSVNNFSSSGEAYGISLGYDTDTNTHVNNIIYKNYIANNKGGSKQYGYRDFASVTTTNLIANISFGQGKINPSPITQLVLTNNMNYMFTLPVNKAPAYVVVESSTGEVAEIKVKPFGNLSVY